MDELAYEALTGHRLISQGDNWKTLCPVHSEKTPSFYIHKQTCICHCFGCGAKGYIEYVLAKAYELPAAKIRTDLDIPLLRDVARITKPEAAPSFQSTWLAAYKQIVNHPFLERRGFLGTTVLTYDARWDPAERRIIFPIWNLGRELVGAVGRATASGSKWKFYWDTKPGNQVCMYPDPYFDPPRQPQILCEGFFDMMWLHQHGYDNVACLIRAIPTRTQINILKDTTKELIVFLDNDEAGRIGQEIIANELGSSVQLSFAKYPAGRKDPQELTKTELDMAIRYRQTYVQYSIS